MSLELVILGFVLVILGCDDLRVWCLLMVGLRAVFGDSRCCLCLSLVILGLDGVILRFVDFGILRFGGLSDSLGDLG